MKLTTRGELLELLACGTHLLFAADPPKLAIVSADPADDKIIGCAVALRADVIVSGDKALLKVGSYREARILNPRELLKDS